MWALGHLGIGSKLASPWAEGLPKRWLLVGTVLPDLIDKPLYYGLVAVTGRRAAELGKLVLISGTQSIGHMALVYLGLGLIGLAGRSRILGALALGGATHLLLDGVSEHLMTVGPAQFHYALLFPFLGFRFPVMPYGTFAEHFRSGFNPFYLVAEFAGLALLSWDFWKSAYRAEIMDGIRSKRIRVRKNRASRRK